MKKSLTRLLILCLSLALMLFSSACGSKTLQDIGCDLLGYEEITVLFAYTDISHSFPTDTGTHEGTEKIPVVGRVTLVKSGPKTYTGTVLVI